MMEDGVSEVPPCFPRVQGGCGGPFRLYGVSLVVWAMGDKNVEGHQLIHLCGVGEVILAASFLRMVVWGMM